MGAGWHIPGLHLGTWRVQGLLSVQSRGKTLENWGAVWSVHGCGKLFLLAPQNLAFPPDLQCKAISKVEMPPLGAVGAGVAERQWSLVLWGMLAAGL